MAKVALLIGVSEYEVGLNPLPAAVKDVVALERILKDSEMGDFDEVKTLTNPEPQVMQYEVETLFSGRSKDDFVLLFFSGHGIKDDSNNLYFATRITKKSAKGDLIRSTAVPARFVHEVMNNSRAKRQAIILDCCFSGAFDPSFQSKDDGSVDLQGQLGSEGRVVLTSSSSTQYSFEQQGSDLSLYTRYLIEGIETGAGDIDEDGKISVRELHEYATSRLQETAPSMTPKLIILKDMGLDIVLAKAKVTDPKLRYRKTASRYSNVGIIRPAGRAVLNTLRQQLGLTVEETSVIENELLRPYQERLANLQQYREAFIAEAEHEYPLSEFAHEDLIMLQQMLGLRDEDILPIQQEVEARFTHQSEAYQQYLVHYEQTLTEAIQREFPLSQQTRQELENLQQSLDLRGDDIGRIERPRLEQAELTHQERLRQEAEQQQQQQERVEYENSLRRYEQEFQKALDATYPLSQSALDGLKHIQVQLKLNDEDIAHIEQPLQEKADRKHQERLKDEARLKEETEHKQREREKPKTEEKPKIKEMYRLVTGTGYSFCSALEIDYTRLRAFLSQENWQEADQETLKLLNLVQGKKDSIYKLITSNLLDANDWVKAPLQDLRTLDRLWRHYSNDHFGLTVQREIGYRVMNRLTDNKNNYNIGKFMLEFGSEVGWHVNGQWISPAKAIYQFNAPKGHLPSSFRDGFANSICTFGYDLLILLWKQLDKIQESDFLVLSSAQQYNVRGVENIIEKIITGQF